MESASARKLREIFTEILELDEGDDIASVRRITAKHWDSLAQTAIVAAIEAEFGLTLSIAEMERISSFLAAQILLEEKNL